MGLRLPGFATFDINTSVNDFCSGKLATQHNHPSRHVVCFSFSAPPFGVVGHWVAFPSPLLTAAAVENAKCQWFVNVTTTRVIIAAVPDRHRHTREKKNRNGPKFVLSPPQTNRIFSQICLQRGQKGDPVPSSPMHQQHTSTCRPSRSDVCTTPPVDVVWFRGIRTPIPLSPPFLILLRWSSSEHYSGTMIPTTLYHSLFLPQGIRHN